jgi:exopolysaccharide production protein ExoQ
MRRLENSPARRTPRRAPVSAAAAVDKARGWLVDSKYQFVVTLMMYVLMYYSTVASNVLTRQGSDAIGEVDPVYRTLKLLMLASGAVVLLWRHTFALVLAREVNKFFIAFVALVLLSTAWSIEPAITVTRFFAILTICLVCGGCVMVGWYERRFQEIVRSFLTALMVGSLIYGLIAPDLAKEHGTDISLAGSWMGLTTQKNVFGHAASICVFLWLHGLLTKEVKFLHFALGFGSAATCLILSRSSTSLFSALFSCTLLLLLLRGPKGKRQYMAFIVAAFAALILLYSMAVLNIVPGLDFLLQPVTGLTGKDTTFSGRTQIWAVIREHISQRPLLGTGYGAYWIGPLARSPSSVFITKKSEFYPTEAHNGYLDIINDLGYVGLVCLFGYLLVFLRQSLALLKIEYKQATLYLALLFGELINNLTESDWFGLGGVATPIVTLATFAMARTLLEQRWRTQSQELPLPTARARSQPPGFSSGRSR